MQRPVTAPGSALPFVCNTIVLAADYRAQSFLVQFFGCYRPVSTISPGRERRFDLRGPAAEAWRACSLPDFWQTNGYLHVLPLRSSTPSL